MLTTIVTLSVIAGRLVKINGHREKPDDDEGGEGCRAAGTLTRRSCPVSGLSGLLDMVKTATALPRRAVGGAGC